MSEDHILVSRDGPLLEIRFNRPQKKNAFTNPMYGAMADAIEAAQHDDGVRVILFTAAGDFFSAGSDIAGFVAVASGAPSTEPRHVERFLEVCIRSAKPMVAAVQGNAVGVGTTMLFQCDLVYVADGAKLTTPFINLGLVPENASSLTMVERLGYSRAFSLLVLGEALSGADAVGWGLASAALPAGDVEARARAAAQTLAQKPPESVRLTKGLMRDNERLVARMREESAIFAGRLKSPEAAAAFAAFMQRR